MSGNYKAGDWREQGPSGAQRQAGDEEAVPETLRPEAPTSNYGQLQSHYLAVAANVDTMQELMKCLFRCASSHSHLLIQQYS